MGSEARGRLLLVEDEAVLRRLIADFLRGEGYDVMEAADGSEGATLYAGHSPFDLVLLDLNLPLLSGVDVCRRIKAQRPSQPVLICSAAILEWHVAALRDLDVDQFLTKPYHPLDLLDRIGRELSRRTTHVPGPMVPVAASPESPPRGGPKPRPHASGPIQAASGGLR